jgi:hypothetical protein
MPFDFSSFFTPRFGSNKNDIKLKQIAYGPLEDPDLMAERIQSEQPEWKKKVRGLFEGGYDVTAGLLGLPGPDTTASKVGELLDVTPKHQLIQGLGTVAAGIPFIKMGKKLGFPELNKKPVVWRGDPGGNREINPQYFDRTDTLGYMGHAAEDQDYALNSYSYRHGSPIEPSQTEGYYVDKRARPNLSAVTSTAENAVDITKLPEDPEDVEKLIKGLELWNPARSARGGGDRLTRARADDLIGQIPKYARQQIEIDKKIRGGIPLTSAEIWQQDNIRTAMKDIRIPFNDPDITALSGFDAFRYDDAGRTSWAFPDISKMETPWGTKLGSRSMGEYPYRVEVPDLSSSTTKRNPIGHFATKEDAFEAASKQGQGSRIYLGNNVVDEPVPKLNDTTQNKLAKKMYQKDYDTLNDWQKEDVNDAVNKFYEIPDDDLDDLEHNIFNKADDTYVNPLQLDATPNQIKKFKEEGVSYNSVADHYFDEKYADLDENQQKEVKDFVNWIEKGAPSSVNTKPKLDEWDEEYWGPAKSIAPTGLTADAEKAEIAQKLYNKSYNKLSWQEQDVVEKEFNYKYKQPPGTTAISSKAKTGSDDFQEQVTKLEELFKSGGSYEEAAEFTFNKDWEQLTKGQKQFLLDVENSTLPSTGKTYQVEVADTMDEVLEQLAQQEYGESYKNIAPSWQEYLQKLAKSIAHKALTKK